MHRPRPRGGLPAHGALDQRRPDERAQDLPGRRLQAGPRRAAPQLREGPRGGDVGVGLVKSIVAGHTFS